MGACMHKHSQKQPIRHIDALNFSSDNGWTGCFDYNRERLCPFGVHKPWIQKGITFEALNEIISYCPDITILAEKQKSFLCPQRKPGEKINYVSYEKREHENIIPNIYRIIQNKNKNIRKRNRKKIK